MIVSLAAGLACLEMITPSVADAAQRVAAIDRSHGGMPVQIPTGSRVAKAIIAAEDERFLSHHGIDVLGVARAAWGAATHQDLGGSTLDQQLAKVLYTKGHSGLISRIVQVALALKLEGHYTKDAILSMYLSAVYFGNGYYGIDAASRGYFGVSPDRLSWGQAALLVGLPQAPTALNPRYHLAAARSRQHYVLDRLVADGMLTPAAAAAAWAAPLGLTDR